MRVILTLTAAAALLVSCNNQPATNSTAQLEQLYKKSYDLKDVPTAITAVQLILLQDSSNNLRDSLPGMYLAVQNIDACLATTEDALKRKPNDEELLKYKLLCLEQTGEAEKMYALAENLYKKTGKAEYIYKVASVQLVTNKLDEAARTIDEMMVKYKDSKDSVDIFIDQAQSQRVPVVAACWNMKGYMHIQNQKYQQAAESYQKAIQMFPDFVMARRNLQQLVQGMQQQQGGRR
ncbi:MAG: tetratricopeptide repeat protein [Bacteroidota bacterium]